MQPDPNQSPHPNNNNMNKQFLKPSKQPTTQPLQKQQCLIQSQINHYQTSLPQTPRSFHHFFFKQTYHQLFQLSYTTLGFNIGYIPLHLFDLWVVIINQIHCNIDNCVLKLIIDQKDYLWVTVVFGTQKQDVNTMRINVLQANYSQMLQKTKNVMKELLQETKKQDVRVKDKEILEIVRKNVCKKIKDIFKNPYIDD